MRVGELAEAVVVIDQRGSGTYADNVEFVVGDAARLTVVSIADWADDAVHVSTHHAALGKDAVLRHIAVALGGDLVRLTARVRFDAPGGDAELLGLYFADDGQHFESRLLVDHAQPNCRSNVTYKGALQGDPDSRQARRPYGLGRRRADPGAGHRHRHLRGEPQPGAHRRRPRRLDAEPGDRDRRNHSAPGMPAPPDVSTTSRCSTCRSRGIPEDQARRLIVRGFFNEIIAKIAVPAVRERLTDAIEDELAITDIEGSQ